MRTTFLTFAVMAFLLVSMSPANAGPVTMSIIIVGGGGELTDGSHVAVNAVSLLVSTPGRNISRQTGGLVVDGVRTKCAISSFVSCSEVTLACNDSSTHQVTAGVPGVSLGGLDGVDLAHGFVHMQCVGH